jgi:hypothetical protein
MTIVPSESGIAAVTVVGKYTVIAIEVPLYVMTHIVAIVPVTHVSAGPVAVPASFDLATGLIIGGAGAVALLLGSLFFIMLRRPKKPRISLIWR